MAGELEILSVGVEVDASKTSAGTEKAKNAFVRMQQTISNVMNKVRKSVSVSSEAVKSATTSAASVAKASSASMESLNRTLEATNAQIEATQNKMNALKQRYGSITAFGKSDSPRALKLSEDIAKLEARMASLINKSEKTASSIWKVEDAMNATSDSTASKGIESTDKKVKSLNKNMDIGSKVARALGSAIRSAFLISVIIKGLRGAAQWIGKVLQQNTALSASLAQVKGNLMSAFAPIISSILPSLVSFMQGLAMVTAYVADFIAGLFGKSLGQAQKMANAMNNSAKATDKQADATKNAAKEARRAVAPFDQLNDITQESADTNDNSTNATDPTKGAIAPAFDFAYSRPEWMNKLIKDVQDLWNGKIKPIIDFIKPYVAQFATFIVQNFNKVLVAIALVTAGIMAFKATSAVFTFVTSPIGRLIIVIAALTAGFMYLWNTNEGFRKAAISAWENIQRVMKPILEWIMKNLDTVAYAAIGLGVALAIVPIISKISIAMSGFGTVLSFVAKNPVILIIAAIIAIVAAIDHLLKTNKSFKTGWDNFWRGVYNTMASIGNSIIKVINTITDAIRILTFGIVNIPQIPNIGYAQAPQQRPKSMVTFGQSSGPMKSFASGAIVSSPTLAMVGDNKRSAEVISPLHELQSMLTSAVTIAMQSNSGNQTQFVAGDIYIGEEKMGQVTLRALRNEERRTGRSLFVAQ